MPSSIDITRLARRLEHALRKFQVCRIDLLQPVHDEEGLLRTPVRFVSIFPVSQGRRSMRVCVCVCTTGDAGGRGQRLPFSVVTRNDSSCRCSCRCRCLDATVLHRARDRRHAAAAYLVTTENHVSPCSELNFRTGLARGGACFVEVYLTLLYLYPTSCLKRSYTPSPPLHTH
jgi:hypothetical protein